MRPLAYARWRLFLRLHAGTRRGRSGPLARNRVAKSRSGSRLAYLIQPPQEIIENSFGWILEPVHRLNAALDLAVGIITLK